MELLPQQLVAGDSWSWTVNLPGYSPENGDVLKAFFRGKKWLDLEAAADPDNAGAFLFTATKAQTADLDWGTFLVQFVVVNGDKRTDLGLLNIEIRQNFETYKEAIDARSWTRRVLDAARANFEGRAGRADREIMVAGRQLQFFSPKELLDLIKTLEADYALEQQRSNPSGKSNQILARFTCE